MGNAVENIYNSEAYRRYFDNCGPLVKPTNISLTFNTDRVKRLIPLKHLFLPIYVLCAK